VALGFLHRDEVLDADRIEQLSAQTLCRDAGADALARRVHGRGGTGGTSAHHQHIVGCAAVQTLGLAARGIGVELREDLREQHASLAERLAVEKHAGNRHHAAPLDFLLKQRAVDHGVTHPRIHHRHEIERLNHVRAALAA